MRAWTLLVLLALAGCSRGAPSPPRDASGAVAPIAVAQGVIDAEAGLIRVRAPRDGVVERTLVEEGDHVAAGQILAMLQDRQVRLNLQVVAAEVAQGQAQMALAAARAQAADREAQRLGRLAQADAATRQDAERAATAATMAHAEQGEAAAALRAAQARRELGAYEVQVRSVRATVPGHIVRRAIAPGAYVAAATSLFVLEPDGRRVVRAELDEAFAGRVRPGMAAVATRQFQAGRSYPAHVLRVSDILSGPSLPDEPASKADARVVTVILSLTGAEDLRLGERVLVRFTP